MFVVFDFLLTKMSCRIGYSDDSVVPLESVQTTVDAPGLWYEIIVECPENRHFAKKDLDEIIYTATEPYRHSKVVNFECLWDAMCTWFENDPFGLTMHSDFNSAGVKTNQIRIRSAYCQHDRCYDFAILGYKFCASHAGLFERQPS